MDAPTDRGEQPDWSLATWDGARREQLRRWAALPLERVIAAIEEMGDLAAAFSDHAPPLAVREVGPGYGGPGGRHELPLAGCTPEPLMSYLKALGVLRVVSEQLDARARGRWAGDAFVLRSSLDRAGLLQFFTEKYAPSPIVSPWNQDAGFLTEIVREELEGLRGQPRFAGIRSAIESALEMPAVRDLGRTRRQKAELIERFERRHGTKNWRKRLSAEEREDLRQLKERVKSAKAALLARARSELSDRSVAWLDACVALRDEGAVANPILGSGGSDGRLEFSANFLKNAKEVVSHRESAAWLEAALFGTGGAHLADTSIGQYAPGGVGGPNATQGFERASLANPWDVVLMSEGVVLFAGAQSRRLGQGGRGKTAFPFMVRAVAGGHVSKSEGGKARGEVWLPLWTRMAGLAELSAMLAEGRAEWRGRQSRTSVDFARAVASLGVDRGIDQFARTALLMRSGRSFLATPLGRFPVTLRDDVHLLREADQWLDRLRVAAGDTNAPLRFGRVLRQVDEAILAFCRYGGPTRFQEILIALGRAEREIASGERFRTDKHINPLSGLSPEWAAAADDGSTEFNLARALAGVHDPAGKIGPLRTNLEPVAPLRGGGQTHLWAERDRAVVWTSADVARNLAGILSRRLMDAAKAGCEVAPLAGSAPASLESVAAFVAGEVDDGRIADLLWGLVLLRAHRTGGVPAPTSATAPLPRAYALLKLLFLPQALRIGDIDVRVSADAGLIGALTAGRGNDACRFAARRLRERGLVPLPQSRAGSAARDSAWNEAGSGAIEGRRLAAALLIPIADTAVRTLRNLVLRTLRTPDSPTLET